MTDGRSAASNKGMLMVRIVPETVPCECSVKDDADAGIRAAMGNIIESLIKPLSAEEQAPKRKERAAPSRIVFKGQLEEVNRFLWFGPNCP